MTCSVNQSDLVFGSGLCFHSQMFTFLRNIASTARSYSGKIFTYIKQICKTKSLWPANTFFLTEFVISVTILKVVFVGNMSEMEQFLIHAKTEKKA